MSCLLFCKGVDYVLKSVKFYTKVGTKNFIFYIALLSIILLGFRTITVLESSVFQYTKYFYFGYIFFNFFLIITSASMIHKKSNVLTFLEKNKEKKIVTVFISNLIIALFASIPMIMMILIFKSPTIDSNTSLLGVTHFLIIWITCNLFSISLGIISATIIKNNFSIIFALIIYCLFLYISFSILPNSILNRFLSIFDDYTYIASNDLAGIIFNAQYFKDKFFIVLLSFILFFIGLIIESSTKKLFYLILSLVPTVIFILLLLDGMHEQDRYTPISVENSEKNYIIENYAMDIDLKNRLVNHIEIDLTPTKNSKNISFLLDNHFSINSILIDREQIKYKFSNNSLDINYEFIKDKKVTIQLEIESDLFSVKNNLGYDLFYIDKKTINLSGDEFHWYPTSLDSTPINYNVKINSSYNIYSNLPKFTNSDSELIFKGSAKNVSLFAGYYQEYSDQSIEYIYPLTYKIEDLQMEIDRLLEDSLTNQPENFSEEELNVLRNKSYTKVIVGNWEGNNLKIDNNTLLIKYINY